MANIAKYEHLTPQAWARAIVNGVEEIGVYIGGVFSFFDDYGQRQTAIFPNVPMTLPRVTFAGPDDTVLRGIGAARMYELVKVSLWQIHESGDVWNSHMDDENVLTDILAQLSPQGPQTMLNTPCTCGEGMLAQKHKLGCEKFKLFNSSTKTAESKCDCGCEMQGHQPACSIWGKPNDIENPFAALSVNVSAEDLHQSVTAQITLTEEEREILLRELLICVEKYCGRVQHVLGDVIDKLSPAPRPKEPIYGTIGYLTSTGSAVQRTYRSSRYEQTKSWYISGIAEPMAWEHVAPNFVLLYTPEEEV